MGAAAPLGLRFAWAFRSARCCASSTARRAHARGRRPQRGHSCGAWPRPPVFVAASRRISYAMPMPWRWPARAFHWVVIQRQLGTPTWALPRFTCRASTTPSHRHRPRPAGADDPCQRRTASAAIALRARRIREVAVPARYCSSSKAGAATRPQSDGGRVSEPLATREGGRPASLSERRHQPTREPARRSARLAVGRGHLPSGAVRIQQATRRQSRRH